MFPVRYELNSYINLLRNSVFKGLISPITLLLFSSGGVHPATDLSLSNCPLSLLKQMHVFTVISLCNIDLKQNFHF
jgi:hypothetical protein